VDRKSTSTLAQGCFYLAPMERVCFLSVSACLLLSLDDFPPYDKYIRIIFIQSDLYPFWFRLRYLCNFTLGLSIVKFSFVPKSLISSKRMPNFRKVYARRIREILSSIHRFFTRSDFLDESGFIICFL